MSDYYGMFQSKACLSNKINDATLRKACLFKKKAEVEYKKGDNDKAIADYTIALELNPDEGEAYYSRGISYHEVNKFNEAIADLTKAIELKPNDCEAHSAGGITYKMAQKFQESIKDFDQEIDLREKGACDRFPMIYKGVPEIYNTEGEVDTDVYITSTIKMLSKNHSPLLSLRLTENDNFSEELLDHLKALELDPTRIDRLIDVGNIYYLGGNLNEAIAAYTNITKIDQTNIYAYANRATCYKEIGEFDKAIVDYSKLIELQEVVITNMKQTAEPTPTPAGIPSPASSSESMLALPNLEETLIPASNVEQAELPQQDVPDFGVNMY